MKRTFQECLKMFPQLSLPEAWPHAIIMRGGFECLTPEEIEARIARWEALESAYYCCPAVYDAVNQAHKLETVEHQLFLSEAAKVQRQHLPPTFAKHAAAQAPTVCVVPCSKCGKQVPLPPHTPRTYYHATCGACVRAAAQELPGCHQCGGKVIKHDYNRDWPLNGDKWCAECADEKLRAAAESYQYLGYTYQPVAAHPECGCGGPAGHVPNGLLCRKGMR